MSLKDIKGIGDKTIKKLKAAGYSTVVSVAKINPERLHQRTSLGKSKCETVVEKARKKLQGRQRTSGFKDGNEVKEDEEEIWKISTGSEAVNDILYGGVHSGYITQAYGENSSGKTQLAIQLSANCIVQNEKEVVFIDTEDTYTDKRFAELVEEAGGDPEEAREKIHIAKPYDSEDQIEKTRAVQKMCEKHDIGLVVVDSIIAHFRADHSGRGELAERQQRLNEQMKELKTLARTNNLVVYITNQVMSNPDKQWGDPTEAVGGRVLEHSSSYIVYLRYKSPSNDEWSAKLEDSPNLPHKKSVFRINEKGIVDV